MSDDFARTKVRRHNTHEQGHDRVEERSYVVCPVSADLPDRQRWAGLKAIGIAIGNTQRDGMQRVASLGPGAAMSTPGLRERPENIRGAAAPLIGTESEASLTVA